MQNRCQASVSESIWRQLLEGKRRVRSRPRKKKSRRAPCRSSLFLNIKNDDKIIKKIEKISKNNNCQEMGRGVYFTRLKVDVFLENILR